MMYPRLSLLWQFLRDDGSLWISIDDNEVSSLRTLMDEIAGRKHFIACNIWQKRYSRENREAIGDVHEYLVVYAKEPELFKQARNRVPPDKKIAKAYKNPNNDPKGPWRGIPMNAQGYRPNQMYPITTPGGKTHYPPKGRCWSLIEPEYQKLLAAGRIYFGKNGNSQPNIIRYLSEVEGLVPWTWWPHEEVGHTDEAKKEINTILQKPNPFETPKPTRLIERVIQIASCPGDLILDSFAGSGTTGHAVLRLNSITQENRRFILIEMDKTIAQDITAERLRRASQGYEWRDQKGDLRQDEGLGGGFRYCELGPTLFDASGQIRAEVTFADMARHVFFVETGQPLPSGAEESALLGTSNETAVYLLYNGVMRDAGNVLTPQTLAQLPPCDGPKVIYADGCKISRDRLRELNITFKQIPYEVKVR